VRYGGRGEDRVLQRVNNNPIFFAYFDDEWVHNDTVKGKSILYRRSTPRYCIFLFLEKKNNNDNSNGDYGISESRRSKLKRV